MKNLFAIILVVVGIALIFYGFNHMNTTESEIKDLFGKSDTTGILSIVIGVVLAIAGVFSALKKR